MIELSQIPADSKLKDLRGQINTMVDEINTDQMVIGQVLLPSAVIYGKNTTILGSVTSQQWQSNQVFAVCMPEQDAVYVAQVFGVLVATPTLTKDGPIDSVRIDIPAVKLPNRETPVSTFLPPEPLGYPPVVVRNISNTGLVFGLVAKGPNGSTAAATDITLCNNSTAVPLNLQQLVVDPNEQGFMISLAHSVIQPPQS